MDNGAAVDAVGDRNETPLHIACRSGNIEMMRILLERNACVDIRRTYDLKTPLHLACLIDSKSVADVVDEIIVRCEDIDERDASGNTPLHHACRRGCFAVVVLLVKAGANSGAKDVTGKTPFHATCEQQGLKTLMYLLAKGADMNSVDNYRNTPLNYACRSRFVQCVVALLDHGADALIENKQGKSALQSAANTKLQNLIDVLYQHKQTVDVDAVADYGDSRLHVTCIRGDTFLVDILLSLGADVNLRNSTHLRPLDFAVMSGRCLETVDLLLKNGADVNCD